MTKQGFTDMGANWRAKSEIERVYLSRLKFSTRQRDGEESRSKDALAETERSVEALEITMIDKKALADDLTEAFIGYQHRLDCPMPSATETQETIYLKYRSDPIFHARVDSLVAGVMQIVDKRT